MGAFILDVDRSKGRQFGAIEIPSMPRLSRHYLCFPRARRSLRRNR